MITPREAMVYVDGYLAGTVDEFDGTFQRLHVAPGEHELVIYLQGYRTIRQHLYLGPNATRKITETMEKLAAGEEAERPPAAAATSSTAAGSGRRSAAPRRIRGEIASRSSRQPPPPERRRGHRPSPCAGAL